LRKRELVEIRKYSPSGGILADPDPAAHYIYFVREVRNCFEYSSMKTYRLPDPVYPTTETHN
jgi:hypothetical protein